MSHMVMNSKIIPPSFSTDTQGGMKANSSAEHKTQGEHIQQGNGSVHSSAKEATFPTVWTSRLTSVLKCASHIFSTFTNTLME